MASSYFMMWSDSQRLGGLKSFSLVSPMQPGCPRCTSGGFQLLKPPFALMPNVWPTNELSSARGIGSFRKSFKSFKIRKDGVTGSNPASGAILSAVKLGGLSGRIVRPMPRLGPVWGALGRESGSTHRRPISNITTGSMAIQAVVHPCIFSAADTL